MRSDFRLWALFDRPVRFLFLNGGIYVLLPSLLLLAAHFLITVTLNVSPLYLRIASFIIPLPFGMAAFALSRIGYRGAIGLGVLTAVVSVTGMLAIVAYVDGAPMVPESMREWRETVEYGGAVQLRAQSPAAGNGIFGCRDRAPKSPLKCANVGRDQNPRSEWPEIPAETPYSESYRKRAVCEDWMVGAPGLHNLSAI